MKYEIEIEHRDDQVVSFFVNNTQYQVDIEIEIGTEQYPVSFNSASGDLTYAESDTIYYHVKTNTLICASISYYNDKDLCSALEYKLNEN